MHASKWTVSGLVDDAGICNGSAHHVDFDDMIFLSCYIYSQVSSS